MMIEGNQYHGPEDDEDELGYRRRRFGVFLLEMQMDTDFFCGVLLEAPPYRKGKYSK